MSILKTEITIKAPELAAAVNAYAEALKAYTETMGAALPETSSYDPTEKRKAAFEAVAELPEDKPDAEPEETAEPEEKEADHGISLEEIREKMVALTRAGKREEMKAIIESFGEKKLTDIPQEKYPELLKKIEGAKKAE